LIDKINNLPTRTQTREAVLHRMGGPFDYGEFIEDLRVIVSEKDQLEREFKTQ
jgi:hypothetical protein